MNSKFAFAVLTVLLYGQGLLGLAGVVTVLLRDRAQAIEVSQDTVAPATVVTVSDKVAVRL
jgi:hypothetical protein